MNLINAHKFEVKKIVSSKIDSVDFEHLSFGEVFTDYMLTCDLVNGEWKQAIIEPYAPFLL